VFQSLFGFYFVAKRLLDAEKVFCHLTMPKQKSELIKWLEARGFNKNPFEHWIAEKEVESLPDYFVSGKNETFSELQGDPLRPQTSIFSGASGSGKSALAYMLDLDLRQSTYGRILPVTFEPEDYLSYLYTKELNWRKILLDQIRHKLDKQKDLLYNGKPLPDFSHLKPDDLPQILKLADLDAIWFILDKLEDVTETNSKPDKVARFLQPLLTDNWLVNSAKNLVFKIFITPQIELELITLLGKNQFERFNVIHQNWDEADLEELLARRLSYFSNGSVSSLGELSEVQDLDTRLCQAAKGSPRQLLRLGKSLLDNHRAAKQPLPDKILRETFEVTINSKATEIMTSTSLKSHIVIVYNSKDERWRAYTQSYLNQLEKNTFRFSYWNEIEFHARCKAGNLGRELGTNDSIVLLLSNELLGGNYNECKPNLLDFLASPNKPHIFPVLVDTTRIERFGLSLYQPVNALKPLSRNGRANNWRESMQSLVEAIEVWHKVRL
jgi:hypothetical protein